MNLLRIYDLPFPVQFSITFVASWGLLYLLLDDVPASKHRHLVTNASFVAFFVYWFAFCLGVDLVPWAPHFGRYGMGDEVTFLAVMGLVYRSFKRLENLAYWKAAFSRSFDLTFTKDGPKLERFASLAEWSARAEAKPYLPPGDKCD